MEKDIKRVRTRHAIDRHILMNHDAEYIEKMIKHQMCSQVSSFLIENIDDSPCVIQKTFDDSINSVVYELEFMIINPARVKHLLEIEELYKYRQVQMARISQCHLEGMEKNVREIIEKMEEHSDRTDDWYLSVVLGDYVDVLKKGLHFEK